MTNNLLSIEEASKYLSIAKSTLRRWDIEGKLKAVRINGGHRRYRIKDLDDFIGDNKKELYDIEGIRTVTYARCSTYGQKQHGDIERQSDRLVRHALKKGYILIDIIKDCGSGLNESRKGYRKLLSLVKEHKVDMVIIENKDRLSRFGFDTIEYFFDSFGTKIEITEEKEDVSFEEELTNDMMMLLASFSGKLYSRRGRENKPKRL